MSIRPHGHLRYTYELEQNDRSIASLKRMIAFSAVVAYALRNFYINFAVNSDCEGQSYLSAQVCHSIEYALFVYIIYFWRHLYSFFNRYTHNNILPYILCAHPLARIFHTQYSYVHAHLYTLHKVLQILYYIQFKKQIKIFFFIDGILRYYYFGRLAGLT